MTRQNHPAHAVMRRMTTLLSALTFGLGLITAGAVHAFDTQAKAAYVYDLTTRTILLSKNADTPLPPASMSKLMTLYIAFEALRDGRLRLDEELPVSSHAMAYGGSTMFLDTTDRVTVEDLIRGTVPRWHRSGLCYLYDTARPGPWHDQFHLCKFKRLARCGTTHVNA